MASDISSIFSTVLEFCQEVFSQFMTATGMLPIYLTMFILFCSSSLIAPFVFRITHSSDKANSKSKSKSNKSKSSNK